MKRFCVSQSGLTLIELILTVFILSTALIGFLKVFSVVSSSTVSASYHSKALVLSQESLDFFKGELERRGDLDEYCGSEVFGGMDPRLRGDDRGGSEYDGGGRGDDRGGGEYDRGGSEYDREGGEYDREDGEYNSQEYQDDVEFTQKLICENEHDGLLLTLITSWEVKGNEYHIPMRTFVMNNEQ